MKKCLQGFLLIGCLLSCLAGGYYLGKQPPVRMLAQENWAATSNVNPDDASLAIDGDPATRWSTNTPMQPGMVFQLDLGRKTRIGRIEMNLHDSTSDFPIDYQVAISPDQTTWKLADTRGNLSPPILTIHLTPVTARYVKIIQTEKASLHPWSIHEITLYAQSRLQHLHSLKVLALSFVCLLGLALYVTPYFWMKAEKTTYQALCRGCFFIGMLGFIMWFNETIIANRSGRLNDTTTWSATTNYNERDVKLAFDGWNETGWTSEAPMTPGMFFELDLGSERTLNKLFVNSRTTFDAPRGHRVQVSMDGMTWKTILSSNQIAEVINKSFRPVKARYIKIIQTGQTLRGRKWSIYELQVYESLPSSTVGKFSLIILVGLLLGYCYTKKSIRISFLTFLQEKKRYGHLLPVVVGGTSVGFFLWMKSLPSVDWKRGEVLELLKDNTLLVTLCWRLFFYSFILMVVWLLFSSIVSRITKNSTIKVLTWDAYTYLPLMLLTLYGLGGRYGVERESFALLLVLITSVGLICAKAVALIQGKFLPQSVLSFWEHQITSLSGSHGGQSDASDTHITSHGNTIFPIHFLDKRRLRYLVAGLVIISCVITFMFSYYKFRSLGFNGVDYGFYIQFYTKAFDSTLSPRLSLNPNGRNFLGFSGTESVDSLHQSIHFEPIKYIYALLYSVFKIPEIFFIFTVIIYFSPILYLVYAHPLDKKADRWFALICTSLYITYPATLPAISNDLRPFVLLPPLFALCILSIHFQRPFRETLIFFIFLCLIREEALMFGAIVIIYDFAVRVCADAKAFPNIPLILMWLGWFLTIYVFFTWTGYQPVMFNPIIRLTGNPFIILIFWGGACASFVALLYLWFRQSKIPYAAKVLQCAAYSPVFLPLCWYLSKRYSEKSITYATLFLDPYFTLYFMIVFLLIVMIWNLAQKQVLFRKILLYTLLFINIVFIYRSSNLLYAQFNGFLQKKTAAEMVFALRASTDKYHTHILCDYDTHQAFYDYENVYAYNRLPAYMMRGRARYYPRNKDTVVQLLNEKIEYIIISENNRHDIADLLKTAKLEPITISENELYRMYKIR